MQMKSFHTSFSHTEVGQTRFLPMKLWKGNVFSHVYQCVYSGRVGFSYWALIVQEPTNICSPDPCSPWICLNLFKLDLVIEGLPSSFPAGNIHTCSLCTPDVCRQAGGWSLTEMLSCSATLPDWP